MRITNRMTTNNLLLNLNRNSERLSKYQLQIATGQKIQKASEDPIVAALALKFRTNVSETVQYSDNVKQATSWMDTTSQSMINSNKILERIKELSIQGASESNTLDDRHSIMKEIEQLTKQLTSEANVTYAGRYVFGGFKTDQEVIFNKDVNEVYNIRQSFDINSIESIKASMFGQEEQIESIDVERIKLPYTDIDLNNFNFQYTVTGVAPTRSNGVSTDPNAYVIGDDEIKLLTDTGEIIFGKNVAEDLKKSPTINVIYEKTSFKSGDLNPQQYFNCTNRTTGRTYVKQPNDIQYEFGSNNKIKINLEGSDVYTSQLIADLNDIVNTAGSLTYRTELEIKEDLKVTLGAEYNNLTEKEIADKVAKVQESEEKTFRAIMTTRFSKLLTKVDSHKEHLNNMNSELGSRVNRLELIEGRLGDDYVNYSELMTKNEGVDFEEAFINYMNQKTIYDSALSVGSKIMQQTLVDYIR